LLSVSPEQFYDPMDRTLTDVEFSPMKSTADIFTRQHEHMITQLQKNHTHEIEKINCEHKESLIGLS